MQIAVDYSKPTWQMVLLLHQTMRLLISMPGKKNQRIAVSIAFVSYGDKNMPGTCQAEMKQSLRLTEPHAAGSRSYESPP